MVESLCLLWVFFWFLFWGNCCCTIFLSRFLTIQTVALWECNLFCDLDNFDRSFPFACCIFPQNWGKHYTLLWSCAGVWTGTLHCISLDSRNSSSVFPGSYFMKQLFFYLNNIIWEMTFCSRNFHLKEQSCLRSVPAARRLAGRKQRGLARLNPPPCPPLPMQRRQRLLQS